VRNAIAYVTPSHQYPLGVTLSLERRLELLAWAAETDSYILEDDYDSDFRFHGAPLAALKGLDLMGRVIYLGTFSKSLGAGLRLGYVIFPAELLERARHMKTLMNNGQPWLEQATLADFMESGGYERHVRRIRKLYYSRRNALLAALDKHFGGGEIIGAEAGMHLAWRLPRDLPPASEIEKLAIEAGCRRLHAGDGRGRQLRNLRRQRPLPRARLLLLDGTRDLERHRAARGGAFGKGIGPAPIASAGPLTRHFSRTYGRKRRVSAAMCSEQAHTESRWR
jgi:hypothetical protein